MYLKGIPDYSKEGEKRETGLFAGIVSQNGELRSSRGGKNYGTCSCRAFNRADGSAVFMTLKAFREPTANKLAQLSKGDMILAAGTVETREYNGKQYTDMLVDLLLVPDDVGFNRSALESRMERAGFGAEESNPFAPIDEEDGELPF